MIRFPIYSEMGSSSAIGLPIRSVRVASRILYVLESELLDVLACFPAYSNMV
ncbi:MAG: hypothetical protein JNL67_10255 [Planctomycetaceae bacterium]|nr:hypothetical protein [Planctomycetaceae bacterium]